LGNDNQKEIKVVNLVLSDYEATRRLLLRAKVQGRNDDTEEIIKERLKVYHKQTKPILDFYQGKYPIYNINGIGSVDYINDEVLDVLE
jgi:adenylate kinase